MKTDSNDEAITLLKSIVSKNNKDQNLLSHIQKLFETKIEMENDRKFLDLLEEISLKIKKDGCYFTDKSSNGPLMSYLKDFNGNIDKVKELLDPLVNKGEDGSDPQPVGTINNVPEYHNLFQSIEWTGYSLGEKESYLLTQSLRNLTNKQQLGYARFWGKIYGSVKDYYIVEAPAVERGKNIFVVIL